MPHPIRGGVPTDQSHGLVTLELKTDNGSVNTRFEFPVNPEDISIDRPSRQAVTQTLTGTYQDHLGQGLMKVRIRGHTGWRQLKAQYTDGFVAYKALRDLLFQYDQEVAKGDPAKVSLRLLMDIPSGWEHFIVSKENASFMRSRSQPLLFRYELDFIVLLDQLHDAVVDPSPAFIITLPSTPPPAIIVSTGGGGGDTTTNDVNDPNSGDTHNGDTTDDDTPATPRKVHDVDDAGVVGGWFGNYDPEWFSLAELRDMGVSTLGGLAAYVYGIAGWNQPGLLWWVIARYNPTWYRNATANSPLATPAGASGVIGDGRSWSDVPIMVRVPKLSGATYNYDAGVYTSVNIDGCSMTYTPPNDAPSRVAAPIIGGSLVPGLADLLDNSGIGDAIGDFINDVRSDLRNAHLPGHDVLRVGHMGLL